MLKNLLGIDDKMTLYRKVSDQGYIKKELRNLLTVMKVVALLSSFVIVNPYSVN